MLFVPTYNTTTLSLQGHRTRRSVCLLQEPADSLNHTVDPPLIVLHPCSRDYTASGDVVLSVADSAKENKQPPKKKEGSKTMAELQVRIASSAPSLHHIVVPIISKPFTFPAS